MNSHLTSAKSCSWYAKERLRNLGINDMDVGVPVSSTLIEPDLQVHGEVDEGLKDYDPQQDPDIAMEFGPYGDELQFLPDEHEELGDEPQAQAGTADNTHSRHTILDDDDDERITIVDESAGKILRKDTPPRHTQVDREGDTFMEEDGKPNRFAPFSSELDWRVAHWAVKDGPGQNAFNRFLEIPGVSNLDEILFSLFIVI